VIAGTLSGDKCTFMHRNNANYMLINVFLSLGEQGCQKLLKMTLNHSKKEKSHEFIKT
jgi:hypothetical protein